MFFEHTYEGPDDMPGHMKSSLIGAYFSKIFFFLQIIQSSKIQSS